MLGVGCRIRPTFGQPEPHNTKIFCYLSNSILLCYNMLMLTKEKGDIAVADAIHFFTINRYEVCLPIGDKRNYDLVVEKNYKLQTVQVKYAGIYPSKKDQCHVGLRITGGNQSYSTAKKYLDDAFDLLFIYTGRGESYLIPWKDVKARNDIWIEHPKYQRYNVTACRVSEVVKHD